MSSAPTTFPDTEEGTFEKLLRYPSNMSLADILKEHGMDITKYAKPMNVWHNGLWATQGHPVATTLVQPHHEGNSMRTRADIRIHLFHRSTPYEAYEYGVFSADKEVDQGSVEHWFKDEASLASFLTDDGYFIHKILRTHLFTCAPEVMSRAMRTAALAAQIEKSK